MSDNWHDHPSSPNFSKNLQYNTLVHWVAGTNDSSTKCLMFQVLFFFRNFLKNLFNHTFLVERAFLNWKICKYLTIFEIIELWSDISLILWLRWMMLATLFSMSSLWRDSINAKWRCERTNTIFTHDYSKLLKKVWLVPYFGNIDHRIWIDLLKSQFF